MGVAGLLGREQAQGSPCLEMLLYGSLCHWIPPALMGPLSLAGNSSCKAQAQWHYTFLFFGEFSPEAMNSWELGPSCSWKGVTSLPPCPWCNRWSEQSQARVPITSTGLF